MSDTREIALEVINAIAAVVIVVLMLVVAAAAPGFFVIMAVNAVFPALAIPLGFWSSVAATFLLATLCIIF